MTTRRGAALVLVLALLRPVCAEAHDPSSWGGLFRSRDHGARWLPVNEGRFIGAALGLAVNPSDPHHLLLATDSGLLRSRNGGRDWQAEAPAELLGSVFAVCFRADGVRALAVTAQALFRTDDGISWRRTALSRKALPARAIFTGAADRVYVAGADGLWRSDDGGASWAEHGEGLPGGPVSASLVTAGPPETIWAVAGNRLWKHTEGDVAWVPSDAGMPEGGVEAVASEPADVERLWAAAADQVYRSDDRGQSWVPIGRPLPEAGTSVRGIAVAGRVSVIALTTHRGIYRSANGGLSWELLEGMLPAHLEAALLVRDPVDRATLYAGFAITPYEEMWKMAAEGGTMLGRLHAASLAGGAAFLLTLALLAFAALRWLGRYYGRPRALAGSAPERIR